MARRAYQEFLEVMSKEHPGQLGKLDDAIKAIQPRVRLHEPLVEVVARGDGSRPIHLLKGGAPCAAACAPARSKTRN